MTGPNPPDRGAAVRALQHSMSDLTTQFRRYYAQGAEALLPGLSPGAFHVLIKLELHQPIAVSRLAELLGGDKGLVSRQVSELARLGLVERAIDPADGRVKLLSATQSASERLAKTRMPFETLLAGGVEGWSVEEIERLTCLLEALSRGVSRHV